MFLFNCCLLNVDELQDLRFQLDPIDRRSADTSLSFSNSANWIVAICNSSELIELYTETYTVKTRQKKPTSFISVGWLLLIQKFWTNGHDDQWVAISIDSTTIDGTTNFVERRKHFDCTSIALRLHFECTSIVLRNAWRKCSRFLKFFIINFQWSPVKIPHKIRRWIFSDSNDVQYLLLFPISSSLSK